MSVTSSTRPPDRRTPATMRAWVVSGRGGGRGRLVEVARPVPRPAPDAVLVRVLACGVARTDLHLADGDLVARAAARVPGHEVVGEVVATGHASRRFGIG